jgi:glycosyltransferase involved in cell wall biosynthesis
MTAQDFSDSWLVVPLFNESAVIGDVVRDAVKVFPHVVCVDDGSSDDSARLALEAGAHVVRHPMNLGQGAALQTGFDYAAQQPGCRYVVTFDSDGQHQVSDAAAMVQRLRTEELDVVLGSRFLDQRTNFSPLKRFVLRLAVAFTNITTGVKLTDAHNGLRAFRVEVLHAIRLRQNRMAHASELITQIARFKLRYAEEPVHIIYTDYSRAKGQSLWNSVNILVELFFK